MLEKSYYINISIIEAWPQPRNTSPGFAINQDGIPYWSPSWDFFRNFIKIGDSLEEAEKIKSGLRQFIADNTRSANNHIK